MISVMHGILGLASYTMINMIVFYESTYVGGLIRMPCLRVTNVLIADDVSYFKRLLSNRCNEVHRIIKLNRVVRLSHQSDFL